MTSATPRDPEGPGLRAGLRDERDRVADLGLEGRGHLLVEDDAARLQRAVEQAEGVDVVRVARGGRRGSSRLRRGSCSGRPAWVSARERRGRRRRGLQHARLRGDCLRRALRLRRRGDRAPASRAERCARRRRGHRPQRVARRRGASPPSSATAAASTSDPHHRPARSADEAGAAPGERIAVIASVSSRRRGRRPARSSAVAAPRRRRRAWRSTSAKPSSSLQRVDQVEHALAGVRVEMTGRLVAQQQLGLLARARGRSPPAAPRRRTARPAVRRPSRRGRRARAASGRASERASVAPRRSARRRRRSRTP